MMSASTLYRLGGLALMAAFPLLLIGEAIHPPGEQINYLVMPIYPVAHVFQLLACFSCWWACRPLTRGRRKGRVGLAWSDSG